MVLGCDFLSLGWEVLLPGYRVWFSGYHFLVFLQRARDLGCEVLGLVWEAWDMIFGICSLGAWPKGGKQKTLPHLAALVVVLGMIFFVALSCSSLGGT